MPRLRDLVFSLSVMTAGERRTWTPCCWNWRAKAIPVWEHSYLPEKAKMFPFPVDRVRVVPYNPRIDQIS